MDQHGQHRNYVLDTTTPPELLFYLGTPMTKKHYQAIAEALRPLFDTGEEAMLDIIKNIMKVLKAENPRFDQVKFLDYLRGYK